MKQRSFSKPGCVWLRGGSAWERAVACGSAEQRWALSGRPRHAPRAGRTQAAQSTGFAAGPSANNLPNSAMLSKLSEARLRHRRSLRLCVCLGPIPWAASGKLQPQRLPRDRQQACDVGSWMPNRPKPCSTAAESATTRIFFYCCWQLQHLRTSMPPGPPGPLFAVWRWRAEGSRRR